MPQSPAVPAGAPAPGLTKVGTGEVALPDPGSRPPLAPAKSATPATGAASSEKPALPPLPFDIPPILLEGDEPGLPAVSGPGQKYVLRPSPAAALANGDTAVPLAGTGELYLTPRDPECLYAHWDISPRDQAFYNTESEHRHLVVRIHREHPAGELVREIHVHPESSHWFIHVPQAGASYVAELGYYRGGEWRTITISAPVATQRREMAAGEEKGVRFATVRPEIPLPRSGAYPSPVASHPAATASRETPGPAPLSAGAWPSARVETAPKSQVEEAVPVQFEAIARRIDEPPPPPGGSESKAAAGRPLFAEAPAPADRPAVPEHALTTQPFVEFTPEQEQVLVELLAGSFEREEWIGSISLAELIRKEGRPAVLRVLPAAEAGSIAAAQFGQPGPEAVFSPGAPPPAEGRAPVGRQFWFNVNAELIVYGATEPTASVTIGGRRIRLRPDGSFSYRFALPDGDYALPIAATAADGEVRRAELNFHRGSRYDGEVSAHPQDPALKTPSPAHVA